MIQRPSSPDTVRKGVHFMDEHNTVVEVESFLDLEEGIVDKLWYPSTYHRDCKQQLKDEARNWRKSGMGILLHDAFVNPNPRQSQNCLNAFVQLSDEDYCRGVERYLSQQHDAQRSTRKHDFLDDVVEQARYLESLKFLTMEERTKKLAEFAALQSRCAEVFARRMGKADEYVAKHGEDPVAAAKLVAKLLRKNRPLGRRCSIETSKPVSRHQDHVMPTHESVSRRGSFPFYRR